MHLKSRALLGVATVATAIGAALIPATNAFAAPAMTATWATQAAGFGLQNGDNVNVSGTGFKPSTTAYLVECSGTTGQSNCDLSTVQSTQTDASGNFTVAAFPVHTGTVGDGACNANSVCYVAGSTDPSGTDLTQASAAPIQFDRLQITPRTNLKNGSVVNLSGAGYKPSSNVYVSECNSADKATALQHCDAGIVTVFPADANGAFTGTYKITVPPHPSDPGPLACTAGKTCIVAGTDNLGNPGSGNIGGAVVGFAAAPVVKPLSVSAKASTAHAGKGKTFKVTGKATSNGTGVAGLNAVLDKVVNGSLQKVASGKTVSGGGFTFKVSQQKTTTYEVVIAAQKGYAKGHSKTFKVSTP
jgi:hypothetical protein